MSKRERSTQRMRIEVDRRVSKLTRRADEKLRGIQDKSAQASALTSQEAILGQEDDFLVLQQNEKEYGQAVSQNRLILRIMKLGEDWLGFSNADQVHFWRQVKGQETVQREDLKKELEAILKGQTSIDLARLDPGRRRILSVQMLSLARYPRYYRDEYDQIIAEILKQNPGESVCDLVNEEVRSQSETLELLRFQIDFLKHKRKEEKSQSRAQSRQKQVGLGQQESIRETAVPVAQESSEGQETETLVTKPFGLSGWKVYWTNVKFSDNPNHLVVMPTDSQETFESRLEEINAGRREFQIKTASVASCVEMWGLPEFRQRAWASRFKWGPGYVRDWAKLVRGPVRIMMLSDEAHKELIFFAADRDTVYRGVFAGMSS